MKKLLFTFLLIIGTSTVSFGQLNKLFSTTYYNPKINNFSFHYGIGNSVFNGDVIELKNNLAPSFKRINITIGGSYRLRPRLRVRAELTYYNFFEKIQLIQHLDVGYANNKFKVSSIESNISFIFDFTSKHLIDKAYKKINAYSVIGLGSTLISNSPAKQTVVAKIGLVQERSWPVIPVLIFGGGLEYYYRRNISIALEWGIRTTIFDNIDYITNNKNNVGGFSDSYIFYGYKLNYAPTYGFNLKEYKKKHQNPRNKKSFLGLL